MAYSKTVWTEETDRSLANLNKMETQYDEAITIGKSLRADNTKAITLQVVNSLPESGSAGQWVYNKADGHMYIYNGTGWNLREINTVNDIATYGSISFAGNETKTFTMTLSFSKKGYLSAKWAFHFSADTTVKIFIDGAEVGEHIRPSGQVSTDAGGSARALVESGNRDFTIEITNDSGSAGTKIAWMIQTAIGFWVEDI